MVLHGPVVYVAVPGRRDGVCVRSDGETGPLEGVFVHSCLAHTLLVVRSRCALAGGIMQWWDMRGGVFVWPASVTLRGAPFIHTYIYIHALR